MAKLQDIHLEDNELWQTLRSKWAEGDYTAALAVLSESQLAGKVINAEMFNTLTTELVRLQNIHIDPGEGERIPVSTTEPTDLNVGRLWFKINKII